MQPTTMLRVLRMGMMQFEMDESPGKLDQSLIVGVVRGVAPLFQPEMLEDIVRLVVTSGVKAPEVTEVAGIKSLLSGICLQLPNEFLHALRFFHARIERFSVEE